MASLREVLAQRVEESRREALERQPRLGYFSAFENRPKIVFTTRGRVTGLPREKWWLPFAPDGDNLYLLEETGVDADWVHNIVADRRVIVDGVELLARIVGDEREVERARQLCGARCARLGLLVGDLIERGLGIAFEHPGSVALHALSNAAADVGSQHRSTRIALVEAWVFWKCPVVAEHELSVVSRCVYGRCAAMGGG